MIDRPFRILNIEHLGLVAKDTAQAYHFFVEIMGLDDTGEELIASQKTKARLIEIKSQVNHSGSVNRLELLQPSEDAGPIYSFIEKYGFGMHHIAFCVDDIEKTLEYLCSKKVVLIHSKPIIGHGQTKVAFIHPKSTGGFLVELVEKNL